jgi:hypothetical protein
MRILLGAVGGTLLGAAVGSSLGWLLSLIIPKDEYGLMPVLLPFIGACFGATLGLIVGGGFAAKSTSKPRGGENT